MSRDNNLIKQKVIRIITLEGDPRWITHHLSLCHLNPGYTWHSSASISDGGGGSITETFRGTEEEAIKLFREEFRGEEDEDNPADDL